MSGVVTYADERGRDAFAFQPSPAQPSREALEKIASLYKIEDAIVRTGRYREVAAKGVDTPQLEPNRPASRKPHRPSREDAGQETRLNGARFTKSTVPRR
jgi:hypothetical protein